MILLQPLALLALAFALVPPLLHLFQRRRPPDATFPPVRYLAQSAREAERSIRLRHVALMLLRVAAVVLLALAAARPVAPARVGGLHGPTALVLVLDNSLSSGVFVEGRRVLDDLAARARETLRAASSGDVLWLVAADGLARRGTAEELAEMVSGLRPEALRLDLAEAAALGARLARSAGLAAAEVHLLTDFQRSALPERPRADSGAAGVQVLVYRPAGEPPANRAVTDVRAEPPTWVLGTGSVTLRVGGGPAAGRGLAAVSVALGGRERARAAARLGEAVAVRVPAPRPGWHAGAAALEPDELRADDVRPFAVRVAEPVAVAIDDGADPGPFLREALAALEAAGRVSRGGRDEVRIGSVARSGGGILLPPADRLQLGSANRALAVAGVGWRFGDEVRRADTLVCETGLHLTGARVTRRYRLVPPRVGPQGEVLARVGGEPWLVRVGRHVIVGGRLVPEDGDIPLSSRFVPFVGELVLRVALGEEGLRTALPGERLDLPAGVRLAPPADSGTDAASAPASAAPLEPGTYPLLAGADTVGALVVAPDPRESDLTRARTADIEAVLPGARLRIVDDHRVYSALRFEGAGLSDLAPWLLVAALAVVLAEALVASGVRRRTG